MSILTCPVIVGSCPQSLLQNTVFALFFDILRFTWTFCECSRFSREMYVAFSCADCGSLQLLVALLFVLAGFLYVYCGLSLNGFVQLPTKEMSVQFRHQPLHVVSLPVVGVAHRGVIEQHVHVHHHNALLAQGICVAALSLKVL